MPLDMNLFRSSLPEPKGFPLFEQWYARFKATCSPAVDFCDENAEADRVETMLFKEFLPWCAKQMDREALGTLLEETKVAFFTECMNAAMEEEIAAGRAECILEVQDDGTVKKYYSTKAAGDH